MPSLLLFLLLLCRPLPALESRWWSVTAGGETSGFSDADTLYYHGAEGWTRSLYGSAGAGSRWLGAAGLTDQRLWQKSWTWRGIKRMLWLKAALNPTWGVETFGYSTTAFGTSTTTTQDSTARDLDHGWSAGIGLTWCPFPWADPLWTISGRVARSRSTTLELRDTTYTGLGGVVIGHDAWLERAPLRQWKGEFYVTRRPATGQQRLGLLVNRKGRLTRVAGLARAEQVRGRWRWHATAMLGHQDSWFDVEKLVVHDGVRELKTSVGAGLEWRAWKGLSVESSTGWEKTQGAENHWLFAGVKWTQQVWATVE